MYQENPWGEECNDYYNVEAINFILISQDNSYDFRFWLGANVGPPDQLRIDFGSYSSTVFQFNFGDDTVSSDAEFIPEIELNGTSFQNVYHSDLSTASLAIIDCYFVKQYGIVGFKTEDGHTWSLLQ